MRVKYKGIERFEEVAHKEYERKKYRRYSEALALEKMDAWDNAVRRILSYIADPEGSGCYIALSGPEIKERINMRRAELLRDRFNAKHSVWVDTRNYHNCEQRFIAAEKYLKFLLSPFREDDIKRIYLE
jgi:hypothetical protein